MNKCSNCNCKIIPLSGSNVQFNPDIEYNDAIKNYEFNWYNSLTYQSTIKKIKEKQFLKLRNNPLLIAYLQNFNKIKTL